MDKSYRYTFGVKLAQNKGYQLLFLNQPGNHQTLFYKNVYIL
jgi:hypothetical protein